MMLHPDIEHLKYRKEKKFAAKKDIAQVLWGIAVPTVQDPTKPPRIAWKVQQHLNGENSEKVKL